MRSFRSIRVVNLLSFNMLSLSPFILIIYRDTQPNSYLFRSFRFMHFAFSYINRPLSTWCVLDAWSMFFIAANLIVYALCQFFPIRLDSTRLDPTRFDSTRSQVENRKTLSFRSRCDFQVLVILLEIDSFNTKVVILFNFFFIFFKSTNCIKAKIFR